MINKILRKKWIVLLIVLVLFIAIDGLVNNVSIVNRGIVIGLALDMDNDNINVTTQVILPKNGGVSGGNNYAIFSAGGKTIKEGLDAVGRKMGAQISLAHTVVVLMNRDLVTRGQMDIIEYFLTDDELSDTCLLGVSETSAAELMKATVPFGEVASYQIQRILRPIREYVGNSPISLKDFFVRYFAREPGLYLPLIYTEKSPPSTDQSEAGVTDAVVFRSNKTLAFNKSCCSTELAGDANIGLSMLLKPITNGAVTISGRDGKPATIDILDSNSKIDYDMDKNMITVSITMNTLRDSGVHTSNGEISFSMDEVERTRFIEKVSADITAAFTQTQEANIDIFMIYNNMYRKYGNRWIKNASKEDYLALMDISVNVSINQR